MSGECRVRALAAGDVASLRRIAVAVGLFQADELGALDERLSGYLDGTLEGHGWLVAQCREGEVIGAAYFAPEPFSDRVWNLFFVGVTPKHQASGVGRALIEHVEDTLRQAGEASARVLLVETSGLAAFEPTRSFYRRCGYHEEARIRQFYGPDDDKIVFWKSLIE